MAFDLGLTPEETRAQFPNDDDFIFSGQTTWVPFETTALRDGFFGAWKSGARQWRTAGSQDERELVPIADAWDTYEPVGLLGQGRPLALPSEESVYTAYTEDLEEFIDQAIFPMVARLRQRMRSASNPLPYHNRLAALYGKYGLYSEAEVELQRILDEHPRYSPALVNMGNIEFLGGDPERALLFYQRALREEPDNPRILLSIAQINHTLEEHEAARRMLRAAERIDPELAERFAFVETGDRESTRAGEVPSEKRVILWEDEE
jgi:tetratricopeptide (TPR) repeat protein